MSENAKILVIDSDEDNCRRLKSLFSGLQYDTDYATDSTGGAAKAGNSKPDIILVDETLPDKSGAELIKELRGQDGLGESMMVLMHSSGFQTDVLKESQDDINEVVSKDLDEMELTFRIRNLLELKKTRLDLEWANVLLKKEKRLLTKYFSEEIVDQILKDETAYSLTGQNQQVSILFFDIRNSTGIGESLDPNTFAEFLSEFFTDLMDLVYGNHGSVNKMLGDGIMATFGCPVPSDEDVLNCVRCAAQIRDHLQTFNDVRPDYLGEPIRGGIGISTGNVFAGNIGSIRRMEYTVLGDPVNTAARLEYMTKAAGVDILIDGKTRHSLGNLIKVKKVKHSGVRGKSADVEIFYLEEVHA